MESSEILGSRSENESGSDVESDSSSLVYDHEPFNSFRSRVIDLATSLIWPNPDRGNIQVERMRGGGFNRVIGISLEEEGNNGGSLILRIPRFEAARMDHEVAILQFLSQKTSIPIPKVVSFDETDKNPLGSPYMVQSRIMGTDLISVYPSLSHEDQCRVAEELGCVYRRMLMVHSSAAGVPVLAAKDDGSLDRDSDNELPPDDLRIHVAPFSILGNKRPKKITDSAPPESVYGLLTSMFHIRKAKCIQRDPTDTVMPELINQFCEMASQLNDQGYLENDHFCVAHLDLAPRNILVNATSHSKDTQGNSQPGIISGILDWDSAILGPMFMSCTPPMWIWAWKDDEDEDEKMANDEPSTSNGRELKKRFEDAAGKEYRKLAYPSAYRLARRLFCFAIEGVTSNENFSEADSMLDEWANMQI